MGEHQLLVEAFALINRILTDFQDSSAHPFSQLDDLLENSHIPLILWKDFSLLLVHFCAETVDFGELSFVLEYFVLHEELDVLLLLLSYYLFVVLQQLQVAVLPLLQVFEKNSPVVVEVGLQRKGILEVHLLNILFTLFSTKIHSIIHPHLKPIILSQNKPHHPSTLQSITKDSLVDSEVVVNWTRLNCVLLNRWLIFWPIKSLHSKELQKTNRYGFYSYLHAYFTK